MKRNKFTLQNIIRLNHNFNDKTNQRGRAKLYYTNNKGEPPCQIFQNALPHTQTNK